jgi:hypothetical protein
MPKKPQSADTDPYTSASMSSAFGNSPEVDVSTMDADNRVITSVDQACNVADQDIQDARKLIINARRITSKKQGAPPYNPATLKSQGKAYKSNFSTRFLQKELNRSASRFAMPVLGSSTLTAAELPAGWPKGLEKTQFFRDTITRAIRGWKKNDMFWRGISAEVSDYGYGFAAWTDPYEWRPHLVRMDRGFIPRGTEIMEDKLARFTLKMDYRPDELLKLVRRAIDNGSEHWNKDAVAMAVDAATLPSLPQDMTQLRKWEEMIRQQSWDYNYSKSTRVIKARHLYVLEYSGKISHYILWPDGPTDAKLLFEHLDELDVSEHFAIPLVFGYGDGTVQGSWGAGQLLYDLAARVEKTRCDGIDNLLNSNKARLQVANAKDAATAQLVVNDTMIIATGAQFAQNVGGISGDPKGYMILDDKMTQWAQEIVGSYLPPIPLGPSDIKAAQVNAAQQKEAEAQKDVLEAWLKQVALVIQEMTRRMLNPDTDDEYAIGVRKKLLGDNASWVGSLFDKVKDALRTKIKALEKIIPPSPIALTEEEIEILINQPVVQSVTDFTEWAASQRAAFAASVQNNPLFNQAAVARYMAQGVPNAGAAFADSIVVPEGDTTSIVSQQRQQGWENTSMLLGISMPVVVSDNHEVHLEALKGPLEQVIQQGGIQPATLGLKHAAAHFAAGTATKTLPPDSINTWKAWLAQMQRALEAKTQEAQQAQQQQQPPRAAAPSPTPAGAMPHPAANTPPAIAA